MIPLLVAACAVALCCLLVNVAAYGDFPPARERRTRRSPLREHLANPAFLAECAAMALAFAHALLPARAAAGPTATRQQGAVALLWTPLVPRGVLRVLRRRLHAHGWHTFVVGARFRGVTPGNEVVHLARAIDARVPAGLPLAILAYGRQGLIARAYAARHAGERRLRLITLATPHQGTVAPFAPAALRPGSDYLRELAALDPPRRAFDAIAIYSDFDAWVRSGDNAYYPGAFNIEVRGVGHVAMLFSRRIAALVLENLSAPPPAAAAE